MQPVISPYLNGEVRRLRTVAVVEHINITVMIWCKPSLLISTALLLMTLEMCTTMSLETVTEESMTPTTVMSWPKEPDCEGGESYPEMCACDALCTRYGDCCRSSPHFKPEQQHLGASSFSCNGHYVMARCPADWQDEDTRLRCERPNVTSADPLLDAPVTTDVTYRNWHCAVCNRDIEEQAAEIWNAEFDCLLPLPAPYFDGGEVQPTYSYDAVSSLWTLKAGSEILTTCELHHKPPARKIGVLRKCDEQVVSRCPSDWTQTQVERQCRAYTARQTCGRTKYRNPDCAICNGIQFDDCAVDVFLTTQMTLVTSSPSFSMLLDWKRLKRSPCAKKEIYDPIYKKCRLVYT